MTECEQRLIEAALDMGTEEGQDDVVFRIALGRLKLERMNAIDPVLEQEFRRTYMAKEEAKEAFRNAGARVEAKAGHTAYQILMDTIRAERKQ